jgi:hypothetical protein
VTASADALLEALHAPAFVHRFPSGEDNPYRGLLACGDEFVVTADSMSMLAEACATGKPVRLFDYSDASRGWRVRSAYRWKPFVHRLSMAVGPLRMRRDVSRIHNALIGAGRLARLDADGATAARGAPNENTDLARTVERVCALLNR